MHWKIYERGWRGHGDTAAIKEAQLVLHVALCFTVTSLPVNVHLTLTYCFLCLRGSAHTRRAFHQHLSCDQWKVTVQGGYVRWTGFYPPTLELIKGYTVPRRVFTSAWDTLTQESAALPLIRQWGSGLNAPSSPLTLQQVPLSDTF